MFTFRYFLRRYCEEPRARRARALPFEHPVAGPVPALVVDPPPRERVIDVPFRVVNEVRATFPPFSPEVVE